MRIEYRNVRKLVWAGACALEVLLMLYVISFPLACLLDNTRVPAALRPLAHLLETPVSRGMEIYLQLWHVDPDLVRCAMYEP
jgi:hypothetical protein